MEVGDRMPNSGKIPEKPYLQRDEQSPSGVPPPPQIPDTINMVFVTKSGIVKSKYGILADAYSKMLAKEGLPEEIRKNLHLRKLLLQYVDKYIRLNYKIIRDKKGVYLQYHLNHIKNKPSWFEQALTLFSPKELNDIEKKNISAYIDSLIEYRDFWKGRTEADKSLARQQLGLGSPYAAEDVLTEDLLPVKESEIEIPKNETIVPIEETLPDESMQHHLGEQMRPESKHAINDFLLKPIQDTAQRTEAQRTEYGLKISSGFESTLNKVMGKKTPSQTSQTVSPALPEEPIEVQPSRMKIKANIKTKKTFSFKMPKPIQLPNLGKLSKKSRGKKSRGTFEIPYKFMNVRHESSKQFDFSKDFVGLEKMIPKLERIRKGRYAGNVIKESGILGRAIRHGVESIDVGNIRASFKGLKMDALNFRPDLRPDLSLKIGNKKKKKVLEDVILDEEVI